MDLDAAGDDQLLSLWRELETRRNRLAPIDHAIIAQASERHLDHRYGATSLTTLAREALRVGIGEARARVNAAKAAGPRRTPTGQPLTPNSNTSPPGRPTGPSPRPPPG